MQRALCLRIAAGNNFGHHREAAAHGFFYCLLVFGPRPMQHKVGHFLGES
ncbi:MAG: hypothetical protein RL397_1459 [Pseudomonadota bacterium]